MDDKCLKCLQEMDENVWKFVRREIAAGYEAARDEAEWRLYAVHGPGPTMHCRSGRRYSAEAGLTLPWDCPCYEEELEAGCCEMDAAMRRYREMLAEDEEEEEEEWDSEEETLEERRRAGLAEEEDEKEDETERILRVWRRWWPYCRCSHEAQRRMVTSGGLP